MDGRPFRFEHAHPRLNSGRCGRPGAFGRGAACFHRPLEVVTELLNEDGTVARSVTGTYQFSWVVPDRVVQGRSAIPELNMASGILFYLNEAERTIEIVSVGADGKLRIMTGPLGGDYRVTRSFETNGGTRKLKFTRFNLSPEAFESKMEYTDDGGKTWKPGNHQRFRKLRL